MERIN